MRRGRSAVGVPCQLVDPASARRRSRTIRIVVVLPAPFAPRKPKISPGSTRKSIPSRATTGTEPLDEAVDDEGHRRRIARPASRLRDVRCGALGTDLGRPGRAVRIDGVRRSSGWPGLIGPDDLGQKRRRHGDERHQGPVRCASSGVAWNAADNAGTYGIAAWTSDHREARDRRGTRSAEGDGPARGSIGSHRPGRPGSRRAPCRRATERARTPPPWFAIRIDRRNRAVAAGHGQPGEQPDRRGAADGRPAAAES